MLMACYEKYYEGVERYFPMIPFLGGLASLSKRSAELLYPYKQVIKLFCERYFNRTEYFNYDLQQGILRAKMNDCCCIISTEVTAFEKQRRGVQFCKIQCSLTNSLYDA